LYVILSSDGKYVDFVFLLAVIVCVWCLLVDACNFNPKELYILTCQAYTVQQLGYYRDVPDDIGMPTETCAW
jgi:hypothetical protein